MYSTKTDKNLKLIEYSQTPHWLNLQNNVNVTQVSTYVDYSLVIYQYG